MQSHCNVHLPHKAKPVTRVCARAESCTGWSSAGRTTQGMHNTHNFMHIYIGYEGKDEIGFGIIILIKVDSI